MCSTFWIIFLSPFDYNTIHFKERKKIAMTWDSLGCKHSFCFGLFFPFSIRTPSLKLTSGFLKVNQIAYSSEGGKKDCFNRPLKHSSWLTSDVLKKKCVSIFVRTLRNGMFTLKNLRHFKISKLSVNTYDFDLWARQKSTTERYFSSEKLKILFLINKNPNDY